MSDHPSQEINTGRGSHSVQIGTVNFLAGLSREEVSSLWWELWNKNAPRLAKDAANDAVAERVRDLEEAFLSRLEQRQEPAALVSLAQPSSQYSLLVAQREHAKRGDEELRNLLVDLLVSKCEAEEESLESLVYAEAIEASGRLSKKAIAAITTAWVVRSLRPSGWPSGEEIAELYRVATQPFLSLLPRGRSTYDHLIYCGCASYIFHHEELPNLWSRTVLPSVKNNITSMQMDEGKAATIRSTLASNPQFSELVELWTETNLSKVVPTTVGGAIAHSNWARSRVAPDAVPPFGRWLGEE